MDLHLPKLVQVHLILDKKFLVLILVISNVISLESKELQVYQKLKVLSSEQLVLLPYSSNIQKLVLVSLLLQEMQEHKQNQFMLVKEHSISSEVQKHQEQDLTLVQVHYLVLILQQQSQLADLQFVVLYLLSLVLQSRRIQNLILVQQKQNYLELQT